RRVQDRNREDEDRQEKGRDRRSGDLPARGQAERREREPEDLRARVAHEDERLAVRTEVERQEPGTRESACKREREDRVVRMDRDGVDREEDERDAGEG